jgi:hypothetical protein
MPLFGLLFLTQELLLRKYRMDFTGSVPEIDDLAWFFLLLSTSK